MTATKLPIWHDHSHYPDTYIHSILSYVKSIAIVGVSDNWTRPSFFAMKYLQQKGYKFYPVNPVTKADEILGEPVYSSLDEIPVTVDMVEIFRNSDDAAKITEDAIDHGAKIVWMQLGVNNEEAALQAEKNSVRVIMNRCPKIEYSRLNGELSWHGFNSGIISSKRRLVKEIIIVPKEDST